MNDGTTRDYTGFGLATKTKTLSLQVLAAGSTSVSGRVLHADDAAPFVGARIRLGSVNVFTDETGAYRIANPPLLGEQVLLIDGHTNNSPVAEYPSAIAMPVLILANQDNKALTSYIARIDPTSFSAVNPGQAASVTNPEIPGFSLNIPQGASIIGWDGRPIDKVNVRVVPVDRLPIRPLPAGVEARSVYLYYFFREGGGNPTQPIPVTMANDVDALPGEQITLWYYDESVTPDPTSNQWRVMGLGTVSADGKSIVSNPGVGIPKFCCGATFPQRGAGSNTGGNAGDGNGPKTCNPVDLASGNAMVFRPRPFGISILSPIDPNCQYRSTDARIGLFGRGMSFSYDWFAAPAGTQAVTVINPQGVRYLLSFVLAPMKDKVEYGVLGDVGIARIDHGNTLQLFRIEREALRLRCFGDVLFNIVGVHGIHGIHGAMIPISTCEAMPRAGRRWQSSRRLRLARGSCPWRRV